MLNLKITIRSKKSKKNELLLTCRLISERTLKEKGCSSCTVGQNSDDEDIIVLEQRWEKKRFLTEYFRSYHFRALLGAMKWLGRSYDLNIDRVAKEERTVFRQ